MHLFILDFLLLKLPLILCSFSENSCLWRVKHNGLHDEDMQTECVFFIYVEKKHLEENASLDIPDILLPPEKYELSLALDYAIEKINRNPNLLPNMTLGFYLYTEMCNLTGYYNIFNSFTLSNPPSVPNYECELTSCHVLISGKKWTTSAKLAPFMQIFGSPQLTYGLYHPILSDNERFPYMYQLAVKDTSLTAAIVSLMINFSWNWVGLVISDDDQAIQFLSDIREKMQRNQICSAFVNVVSVNKQLYLAKTEKYYNEIVRSSANVVIIYGDMNSNLGDSFKTWEYLGKEKIWVTTTQWDVFDSKKGLIFDTFHKTFTFSHHHGATTGFLKFIQTLNSSKYIEDITQTKLGWIRFNCSHSQSKRKILCNFSSNMSLEYLTWHTFDVAMSEESYNLYNAAHVVAHALHELLLQEIDIQTLITNNELETGCMKLHHYLKNIQFTNPFGDLVNMKEREKLDTDYDIFNVWDSPQGLRLKVKIGQFSPHVSKGQQLQLSEDMIEGTTGSRQIPQSVCSLNCNPGFRKSHQEGQAACCFDCTPCPENEISNETDMEQCVMCPDDQYANKEQTHCLQKAVTFLAFEDPLGMALSCLALCFSALTGLILAVFLKHHDTPIVKANNRTLSYILLISLIFCFLCSLLFIGHPNTATCILQQITFGVFFTVAVSTILAKSITVVLAFKLTAPGRRMRRLLVSGAPNFIIPICTLIQLIICGIWLGTSPPFIETDSQSEHGHIIIVCNKGSVTAFYCVLGYLGSLALGSFTVAFLVRNLPDTFNEAKFLTFSMLVFCSVWITFLPVYHSTKGKILLAVEVFSILASSAGLLGCIFFPKCYIIFLKPDKITLPKYRERTLS